MRPIRCIAGLVAIILLAACGDEGPAAIDELVPEDMIITRELTLDAATFLAADTTISGFTRPDQTGYLVVGAEPDDGFQASGLIRFNQPTMRLNYVDTAGVGAVDTVPTIIGGVLTLVIDSVQSRLPTEYELEVYRVNESWDAATATWALRADTAGAAVPWTEPGARGGEEAGSTLAAVGTDTIQIDVDSATMATWVEDEDAERTLRISSSTAGLRVQIAEANLEAQYRPSPRPDTVVAVNVTKSAASFIYTPETTSDDRLLVGGSPTWRTFFELDSGLDTLTVPHPDDPDGRRLRLRDATINYAALELSPAGVSPSVAPVDSILLEMRPVFGVDELPLSRAPLGDPLGPLIILDADDFDEDEERTPVEAALTTLISALVGASETNAEPPRTIALVGLREPGPFGIAAFEDASAGGSAPRLRIIYSVTSEEVLR